MLIWSPASTTLFAFHSLTMHELHNRNASIGQLYEHEQLPFVFCQALQRVNPKRANKNMQQRTLPGFHTISLY